MKTKYLQSIILFSCVILFAIFTFSALTTKVFAQGNSLISISCDEDEENYYINAFYEGEVWLDNSKIILVINDVEIEGVETNISTTIAKTKSSYTVFAKIIIDEGTTIKSSKLILAGIGNNILNPDSNGVNTIGIVFSTVVPVLLLITFGVLFVIRIAKQKLTVAQMVRKHINEFQENYWEAKRVLKNAQLSDKVKEKKYKSYIIKSKNLISKNINLIIPENIESMGIWNTLLTSFIKTESIMVAGIQTSSTSSVEDKLYFISQLQKVVFPKLHLYLTEVEKIVKKIELNSESLFVQHSKSNQMFSTQEEYKQFLDNTLYMGKLSENKEDKKENE